MQREIQILAREIAEKELRKKVKLFTEHGREELVELWRFLDEEDAYPHEFLKELGRAGIFSVFIPEEYGGLDEGITGLCLATEEIARICPAASTVYAANGLGTLPILLFGTAEQKADYLPRVAAGECLTAFALTEPGSGSDALSLRTRATIDGDFYILSGEKLFITNAKQADLYIVFASTNPERGVRGISGFIIEKKTHGLTFGKKEKKMGLHASETRSLIFSNCRVPKSNLLGGKEGIGAIIVLNTLNKSRIGVGAQSVGAAQGAFEAALNYAKERLQFGKPIFNFQVIAHKLARMAIKIEAARAIVYKAAWHADHGTTKDEIAKLGAMAKCFGSDIVQEVASEAVQILGGCGYMRDYPVEKIMRDVKIFQIYEGTNEVQRNEIIQILIKEAARVQAGEISSAQDRRLQLVEKLFFEALRKEIEKKENFGQQMHHRFADLAMKIESAKALTERASVLKNERLAKIAMVAAHEVTKEALTTIRLIQKGFYLRTDQLYDTIAELLKNEGWR